MNPFDYLEIISKKGYVSHSPQSRYIFIMRIINQLPIYISFKKRGIKSFYSICWCGRKIRNTISIKI